jgi:SPRY domain-containing protein
VYSPPDHYSPLSEIRPTTVQLQHTSGPTWRTLRSGDAGMVQIPDDTSWTVSVVGDSNMESVRASVPVQITRGRRWVYEVTMPSRGSVRVGWSLDQYRPEPTAQIGVGSGRFSFCYAGKQGRLGHKSVFRSSGVQKCRPGDTVSTILDLEEGSISFLVNGDLVCDGPAFEIPKEVRALCWEYGREACDRSVCSCHQVCVEPAYSMVLACACLEYSYRRSFLTASYLSPESHITGHASDPRFHLHPLLRTCRLAARVGGRL